MANVLGSMHTQSLQLSVLTPHIAKPLAGKKLCKRTLKLVHRAAEHKCLKRGVKEVVKSIRRGHKGLCVIAGNISPIDVITHVPILCEESDIPYIYVSSKENHGYSTCLASSSSSSSCSSIRVSVYLEADTQSHTAMILGH
ncbi:H/ACA ribonucleoprotein complex subunit 2-like protein [Glycine soja]|uniref:H/ACA ribonucleoprotein complex subunit 2-like protein n=1 Tax=Glycine soja TaxID=3848 RepID=UPI000233DC08|nr:H/ACA ribonucleoprotein complex subunit 2-like protein [Glycine soja]